MKAITNEKLIKRNGRLGQIATFSGLLVLVGGMFVSFRYPSFSAFAWVALLIGFALSQIGLYFGNRWGRRPRPDELIDQGLKGLSDQYSIYHYTSPAAHLLVGPSGLWVILPYHQIGKIVYEKGRWKQKGGSFMQRYLRVFAQEGLGRPETEAAAEVESISRFLKKNFPEESIPDPRPVLVFTSEKAELEVENAPLPAIQMKKLKETVRKTDKENTIPPLLLGQINELLA